MGGVGVGDLLPFRHGAGTIQNDAQHAFQIVPNVDVGEAQNQIALMCKVKVSISILDSIMAIIIDFYDEAEEGAEKVADIGFDHGLSAEFEAVQLGTA